MSKIPCEVIRDLFPSYIDHLTSDKSDEMIEEHLAECQECTDILNSMRGDEPEKEPAGSTQDKEIDFLKKNRKRNKWIIFGAIGVIVVILVVLFITRYMIGTRISDITGDFLLWDVNVDGNHLSLDGRVVDDIFKFTGVSFTEKDGVVHGEAKVVPSGFVTGILYGKDYHCEYDAKEPIKQVEINARVLWSEGEEISAIASALYITRHDYIGNITENFATANFLGISNYLGPFTNELQTAEEPFGWKLILSEDIPSDRLKVRETDMESFAYVLLAVINNLREVSYEYTVDGKTAEKTVTAKDATEYFGRDIKECYDHVSLLDQLIHKTGLDRYVSGAEFESSIAWENDSQTALTQIVVHVVNNSGEDLSGITMGVSIDGGIQENQGMVNADGTDIFKGQMLQFVIDITDHAKNLTQDSMLELNFSVVTKSGEVIEIPGTLRIPAKSSSLNDIHITGNQQDGFSVSR